MPMSFAASTLPCPAIIPSAPSMRTGLINPNSLMLTAICLICMAVCVRGFRARGFSWWGFLYLIFNAAMARLLQDRRQRLTPSLSTPATAAAQRDRLVWVLPRLTDEVVDRERSRRTGRGKRLDGPYNLFAEGPSKGVSR